MSSRVSKILAAVLALLGLVVTVIAAWVALHVGNDGSTKLTLDHPARGPVVLDPGVLNRLDVPLTVGADAAKGAQVTLALTHPSDVKALIGDSRRTEVTGMSVSPWRLKSSTTGAGNPNLATSADFWQSTVSGAGHASAAISQDAAPQSMVVTSSDGALTRVTLTVVNRSWFVQSVVGIVTGLLLLGAGALLWRLDRARRGTRPSPDAAQATPTTPEVAE